MIRVPAEPIYEELSLSKEDYQEYLSNFKKHLSSEQVNEKMTKNTEGVLYAFFFVLEWGTIYGLYMLLNSNTESMREFLRSVPEFIQTSIALVFGLFSIAFIIVIFMIPSLLSKLCCNAYCFLHMRIPP